MQEHPTAVPSLEIVNPVAFASEHRIHSTLLDEDRTVYVRVPESYAENSRRYPVLYMLDGEMPLFTSHAGVITQLSEWESRIPESIVVGIPNTDRPRDMIPVAIELPNGRKHGGGADRFLQFIATELVPAIDTAYRTHPYRTLSGTSASGLAVVHAFAIGLEGFQSFFASSPTVGSSDRALFQQVTAEGIQGDADRFLAIFSGDDDMEGIQQDSEEFAQLIREHAKNAVEVHHWIHAGEGHCPFDGFRKSLLALYASWQPSDEVIDKGLEAVQDHYQQLSHRFGYPIDLPISAYESIGERMIGSGNPTAAVEILEYGMQQHKQSTRIAFYLAIALARSDQRIAAKEMLEELVAADLPGTNRLLGLLNQLKDA